MKEPDFYNNYLQNRLKLLDKIASDRLHKKSNKINPCDGCRNNPKNNPNASGICNCALPALHNPIT